MRVGSLQYVLLLGTLHLVITGLVFFSFLISALTFDVDCVKSAFLDDVNAIQKVPFPPLVMACLLMSLIPQAASFVNLILNITRFPRRPDFPHLAQPSDYRLPVMVQDGRDKPALPFFSRKSRFVTSPDPFIHAARSSSLALFGISIAVAFIGFWIAETSLEMGINVTFKSAPGASWALLPLHGIAAWMGLFIATFTIFASLSYPRALTAPYLLPYTKFLAAGDGLSGVLAVVAFSISAHLNTRPGAATITQACCAFIIVTINITTAAIRGRGHAMVLLQAVCSKSTRSVAEGVEAVQDLVDVRAVGRPRVWGAAPDVPVCTVRVHAPADRCESVRQTAGQMMAQIGCYRTTIEMVAD